jgi:PKD repeat protein
MASKQPTQQQGRASPSTVLIAVLAIIAGVVIIGGVIAGTVLFDDGGQPGTALAPTATNPVISLEPKIGRVGSQVTVQGQGWPGGGQIFLYLLAGNETELPDTALTSAVIDLQGRFTTSFTFPAEDRWDSQRLATVLARTGDGTLISQAIFGLEAAADQPVVPQPVEPTSTVLQTLQPGPPHLTTATDLNLRGGPGMAYPVLGLVPAGETAEVTGVSADGNWWQVKSSDAAGERGWLSARYVTTQNVASVPLVEAPPLPATPTSTPEPTVSPTPSTIAGWRGEYFDNPNLNGDPVLVRDDAAIDFVWRSNGPDPELPADAFSARWSRDLAFEPGLYRFQVAVDDGARLWIDGRLIIDTWLDGGAREVTADYALAGGPHSLRLEYYDKTGQAEIGLWWDRITTPTFPHWQAEYWPNDHFGGEPIYVRNDETIDFNWGDGAPVAGFPGSNFSVRWSRWVTFVPGVYRFNARADDGIRVFLDDTLILNEWHGNEGNQLYSVDLNLGDSHQLVVEYYEQAGSALAEFWWEPVSPTSTPTPSDTPVPPTPTGTEAPTETPQPSPTSVPPTDTTVPTGTSTPSQTPVTPTPSLTATATVTPSGTPVPTDTPTVPAATTTPTDTSTPTPTGTSTPTVTPTVTETATLTPTATTTPTADPLPLAAFTAGPLRGTVPLTVTFVNSSTNATAYEWSFGDGATGAALNPTHTYTQPGRFNVTLAAGDEVVTDTLSRSDYIRVFGPDSLQAIFSAAPLSGTVPLTVTFTNSSTNAASFVWDYGDGLTTAEISPTHVYTQIGSYTVTLTANDGLVTDTLIKPDQITVLELFGTDP